MELDEDVDELVVEPEDEAVELDEDVDELVVEPEDEVVELVVEPEDDVDELVVELDELGAPPAPPDAAFSAPPLLQAQAVKRPKPKVKP